MVRLLKIAELEKLPEHVRLRLAEGLAPLLRALSYCELLPTDAAGLTVALDEICPAALTRADCQFAAAVGLIEIRAGRSRSRKRQRSARSKQTLKGESVITLSRAGAAWVQRHLHSRVDGTHRHGKTPDQDGAERISAARAPMFYDKRSRELYFHGLLIIKLGSRARNTATLLSRFQKRNWRQQIRNPLKSGSPQGRAQQLRDAVHDLNVRQEAMCGHIYLRFHAHDKGHTLWYELAETEKKKNERRLPAKDSRRR